MLKKEQAEKQLEQLRQPEWLETKIERIKKLPAKLRNSAMMAMRRDADGKEADYKEWDKYQNQRLAAFRGLSDKDRRALFTEFFGELAPAVEAGWQLHSRLPHGQYLERPFRAPSAIDDIDHLRLTWLNTLIDDLTGYPMQAEWIAAWAPHLGYSQDDYGILLAGAIDAGGATAEKVLTVLKDSASGQHEVGSMGQHVTWALLVCSNPDAWEFMQKMLLAAQRQEGLRQAMLESIDRAHPQAFRRMLRVILENDLSRFSATVRAIDTWFGFQWDAASVGKANEVLEQTLKFLDDEKARDKAIKGDDAEAAYLALWSIAYDDAVAAIAPAARLLKHKKPEFRWVGANLLLQLELDEARKALLPALDDEDLRIPATAIDAFAHGVEDAHKKFPDLFDRLRRLIDRAPTKETKLPAIVFPWMKIKLSKKEVADVMVQANGDGDASRLIPYLAVMESYTCARVIAEIAKAKKYDADTRKTLFALAGDPRGYVREAALKALVKCKLTANEATDMEELLTRKAGDLRRGVLALLAGQDDSAALASADRLMKAGDAARREAGLELLRQLKQKGRCGEACKARATQYRDATKKLTAIEKQHIDQLVSESGPGLTLDDALGLMDPAKRTPPPAIKKRSVKINTPAVLALLKSLDELAHAHREDSFIPREAKDEDDEDEISQDGEATTKSAKEPEPILLGQAEWRYPSPSNSIPIEKDLPRFALREIWEEWFKSRPKNTRDADGLEIVRAVFITSLGDDYRGDSDTPQWLKKLADDISGNLKLPKLKYERVVYDVLRWLLRIAPPKNAPDFMLDLFENALASIPADKIADHEKSDPDDDDDDIQARGIEPYWRDWDAFTEDVKKGVDEVAGFASTVWTDAHDKRHYALQRWWDEPPVSDDSVLIQRDRAALEDLLKAFKLGAANEHDVIDHLLGRQNGRWSSFSDLARVSARKAPKELAEVPKARGIAERCRDRVIEVELKRGDTPTAASEPAKQLRYAGGLDVLVRVLKALDKTPLVRHGTAAYGVRALNKASIFSHLITVTEPGEQDTPQKFASSMKAASISEDRLIELALYAPRWSEHVEHTLAWSGFHEAVWWILAHTRNAEIGDDEEEGVNRWEGAIGRYTPLAAQDLKEGAVDVAWFNRAYKALGKNRWDRVYDAAKYASGAGGHKRAQLFADAMLGREKRADMITRVKSKRQQDAARALGLLPLASGEAPAKKDVLERYKVFQEFLRTSRQFGSQRQASEKRAANIGMDNLARTAGYPDPIRLQWAMEALETQDLAKGPFTVSVGDVQVSLGIDEGGMPEVTCAKNGKSLASVPPAARKNPKVQEIQTRKADLRRSASRMRKALELAMCRGDKFSATELRELFMNPMLAPMLARLVFVGEGILGYPVDGGRGLRNYAGKIEPIKKAETLQLAHPHDLLASKKWSDWQRDCFASERVQPFKQIFRELYVLTAAEKKEGDISRRYAGHQIQPRKTIALLTGRGWVIAPEEGAYRTFHEHNIIAYLTFLETFYTPADIEGLTLEGVRFMRRGATGKDANKPLRLADVPARLFSEVMRDVDLVVSVAHRGGVDPEASASTIEMRSTLVRETASLLNLKNVRLKENHVLIKGEMGEYTVHLGSGVVHRLPGGALFIVPVHSQHRGRLFLPFADDDPRTAEVISKVLLLSRDTEIRDPALLDQLRAASV